MIAQGQRRRLCVGQRIEPAEMGDPLRIIERIESYGAGCPVIAEAQDGLRKFRRLHRVRNKIGN